MCRETEQKRLETYTDEQLKRHWDYVHKRNSEYYRIQYRLALGEIVENEGVSYKEARRIYWARLNALKECYANA